MKVEFHSDTLNRPISKELSKYAHGCESLDIAIGFLSKSGLNQIVSIVKKNPSIDTVRIVCGAITGSAVLLSSATYHSLGIEIRIDFPYFHKTSPFAAMMHSKIYIFKTGSQRASIVGSSNLTHFALEGINVEANTITTGKKDEQLFIDQQVHFDNVWKRGKYLDHSLALYYDTLFKHIFKGIAASELTGNIFKDTSTKIHTALAIENKAGYIPNTGQTIVFIDAPNQFRSLNETYHLFYIGADNYILVKCYGGKRESTATASPEHHDYKIIKNSIYELHKCGLISIPASYFYATFEVKKLLKTHDIKAGKFKISSNTFRSEPWIIEHLLLDRHDTIQIDKNEAREDKEFHNKDLNLEKIIGFKESKANKYLKKLVDRYREGDLETNLCFFNEINFDFADIRDDDLGEDENELPEILL